MYQRTTTLATAATSVAFSAAVSDVVANAVSSELSDSLQQTLTNERLATLGRDLSLPTTARSFWFYLTGLLLVCAGMLMHILLSMQIWQTQIHLQELKAEYQTIEQQNAEVVWQIANAAALESVRLQAIAQGYVVPLERHYIASPAIPSRPLAPVMAHASTAAEPALGGAVVDEPAVNSVFGQLWQQVKQWLGGTRGVD